MGKLTVVEVIVMREIKLIMRGNFGKSTDLNSTVTCVSELEAHLQLQM